ncbi:actin-related protein, putative [Plasmodium chabaudi chabaudi]|uniref:Actin-related protein, putative n=1 Tax=Plasmodium chabaudi chabaudi TaxID=31271 RepID=A0A4V0K4D6_PLACU|nr:actin-related protein, putative [Plasmodium chabaudi chabaudi]VTZ67781.1 actin-related protein, putative [Plasmodium chabaudi chabaudi]|eukprot:XP_016653466.1 actin-related protein, putative [Plasmodium chabaudi chabaudi]
MAAPVNIDMPKLILDNGGGLIKGGILPSYSQLNESSVDIEPKFIVPNCVGQIRKKNIFHISDSCYNICEYFCHRPHVDGLLLDLEMQTKIWEKIFSCKQIIGYKINDMAICVTESYLTPAYIRQGVIELLFEYFNFEQVVIVSSQTMLPFSYIGLNLGQYDILNPPIFKKDNYSLKKQYVPKKRRSEKNISNFYNNKNDSPKRNYNASRSSLKNEEDDYDGREDNTNLFNIKQEKYMSEEKIEDNIGELNNVGTQEVQAEQSNEYAGNYEQSQYIDDSLLVNRHIFIKNIECYNKYAYELYMNKLYHGENWQEYYFNSFFNKNAVQEYACNNFTNTESYANRGIYTHNDSSNSRTHNYRSPFNKNNVVTKLSHNNYIGNNFLYQDPSFLLPDKIDLYKNYYDKNFKDINMFKEYYNSTYINDFYSNLINGNYNLSLRNPCALYIDVGFSHTYILPYIEYKLIEYAILRTKVSASVLNTYLKNTLSYKHVNLEHNELLVENIKERACYVSLDYEKDLENEKKRLEKIKKQKIQDKLDMRSEILMKELEEERKKKNDKNRFFNEGKKEYEHGEAQYEHDEAQYEHDEYLENKTRHTNDLTDTEKHYKRVDSITENESAKMDKIINNNANYIEHKKKNVLNNANLKNPIKDEINNNSEEGEQRKRTSNNNKRKKNKIIEPHLLYKYKLPDYNNATKREINEIFDTLKNDSSNDCIYLESDYDYKQEFSNYKEDDTFISDLNVKTQNPQKNDDIINLTNERIGIPEILFNPQDINLNHCSIVELIYRCISLLPKEIQKYFLSQIYISGGSTKFKNFKHRLYKELRAIFPTEWEINIYSHKNSLYSNYIGTYVWLSDQNIYNYNLITRQQYFNNGNKT